MITLLMRRLFPLFVLVYLIPASSTLAAELTVSAAASLADAFRAMAGPFESMYPDVHLQFNFAASGVLLQQISHGAPVDVLATADEETMDQAVARALVGAGARRMFATNRMVLIVPAQAPTPPSMLADLLKPQFARISLGQVASVPAGRYAKSALEQAGLWDPLQSRLVPGQSVRQVLDYVARGEADAGLVYATDARQAGDKVRVALTVATITPIRYPIAPLAASGQPVKARAFVDFVGSPAAQDILARFGFGPP